MAGLATTASLAQIYLNGAGQASQSQSFISIFEGLLVGLVISGIVLGVAFVLLTYDLQDSSGRLELYVAFAAQLIVGILVAYVFGGILASTSSSPSGALDVTQLRNLQTQLQLLELSGLIPAGLFADAYYRAYSRINKGELPQRARPLGRTSSRYMGS